MAGRRLERRVGGQPQDNPVLSPDAFGDHGKIVSLVVILNHPADY